MSARKRLAITLGAVVVLAVCIAFYLTRERTWVFMDVSTASSPYDTPQYNGHPCPECKVIGATVIEFDKNYSIATAVTHPDGWRADITWSAPRDSDKVISLEDMHDLPWRFLTTSFLYMGPSAPDAKNADDWQKVIDQTQKLNGSFTGRTQMPDSSEFVYWGRVSINRSDSKFHCATNCLVFYRWGDAAKGFSYTTHLESKMKSGVFANPSSVRMAA